MSLAEPANDATVTKIVDRVPRAGMERELEAAIHELTQAALKFPGHLGATVMRPSLPAQPGFRQVYKFATSEHLRAWEESEVQHRLVAIANRYTRGAPRYEQLTGLEAWFTPPGGAAAPHPPRGKMTLVSWLGIFPLVYLFGELIAWILPAGTPYFFRALAVTLLVVPTMSYLVGPQLTRLFKGWLYPKTAA
jgi:antibiotic biosynthesis monooxygenase (ABM) superfamily enzyme